MTVPFMQYNMIDQEFLYRPYYITLSWWAIKFISKYFIFRTLCFCCKRKRVWLMCLKPHINHLFLKIFYRKLKKL